MSNKNNFILLRKAITLLSFAVLSVSPLIADNNSDKQLSDIPEFSITYQNETLICSPTALIKTKINIGLVEYECKKASPESEIDITKHEERGQAETSRLHKDVKNKISC